MASLEILVQCWCCVLGSGMCGVGRLGAEAPAMGLGAGSAHGDTPALSPVRDASGGSGDAAQLRAGVSAKVCSNVLPCMLQPGVRPDVLHSWVSSREHQTCRIPSDFISKGVCGAAARCRSSQAFTGLP